jgi:beta-lactamase regulating signal transducer with metallopeptidase domain
MSLAFPSAWLDALAASGHLQRLGWVVLHSLWQAAAVAAVLAIALRLVPRRSACGQEARYLLATLALFSLPVACGITWARIAPTRATPVVRVLRVHRPAPAAIVTPEPLAAADRGPVTPSAAEAFRTLATQASAAADPWLPLCATVWLAGVIAAAVRIAVGWSLTRRLVATAAALPDAGWQARLDRWQSTIGIASPLRLLASARVDVPIVVGWLRPVVIWPAAAVTGMPPEQIDAILAHELAHVRRHDVLVNLLQSVIEAVFFHHPAAWWISAQVRAEREHCADELAIRALAARKAGSRISYARTLLSLEERRQVILAAAANGGSLGDRIRRLAGIEQSSGHPARLAAAVVVVIAVTAALATPPGDTARRAVAAEAASGGQAPAAGQMAVDTNTIESLTPEEATKLVKEFPGARMKLRTDGIHIIRRSAGGLPLDNLKALDAATAECLASYAKGGPLSLRGLTAIDVATAKTLAKFKGDGLWLNGLTALTPDVAEAVAEFKGVDLSLQGLNALDGPTAKALAKFAGQQLVFFNPTLSPEAARALAEFKGGLLGLAGISTIDAETAQALVGLQGATVLDLGGLTTLNADVARVLTASPRWNRRLFNLTRLDAATAEVLLHDTGAVGSLANCTVDEAAAKVLAGHAGPSLSLKLATLSADTARALADFKGKKLELGGLKTLDAASAAALARFKGSHLELPTLLSLDAATATALAAFEGQQVMLTQLATLDDDTVAAVADLPGHRLVMPQIVAKIGAEIPLTAMTARLVCAPASSHGGTAILHRVTALDTPDSIEIAKALAAVKGPLFLPNLKKISPKTLTALIEKADARIPLIETLELIPEPDGSPTEDFVIPDDFQHWQRQQGR